MHIFAFECINLIYLISNAINHDSYFDSAKKYTLNYYRGSYISYIFLKECINK